jgi:Cu2+-exporting ATPase
LFWWNLVLAISVLVFSVQIQEWFGHSIEGAWVSWLASSLGWGDLNFWWELAAMMVVMLLGHWQEMKAIGEAQGALAALAELLSDTAERVTNDGVEEVSAGDPAVDDVVLVRPGGRVPADGENVDGEASFDESMTTGESRSVERHAGDRVVAGTVSTDSSVRCVSMLSVTTPLSSKSVGW